MSILQSEILTTAIDELDSVAVQLREARAQERTASFFSVLLARATLKEREHVGDAIALTSGWCLVHWRFPARRGVALYQSLALLGVAMHIDGEFLLSLDDTSERRAPFGSRLAQTRETLTERERAILAEMAHGLANNEIGERLHLAENTIKNHASVIYRKLCVKSRVQAVLLARDLDLTLVATG